MKNVPRDFNWLPFFVKKKAFYRVFIDLFFPCRPSCVVKCHSEGFFLLLRLAFRRKNVWKRWLLPSFFFTVTEFSLIDAVSGESRRRRVENEFIYFFFL